MLIFLFFCHPKATHYEIEKTKKEKKKRTEINLQHKTKTFPSSSAACRVGLYRFFLFMHVACVFTIAAISSDSFWCFVFLGSEISVLGKWGVRIVLQKNI